MATGGYSLEHQSRKSRAIESLFERLVKETESEVRDSTEKMYERGVITGQQKEDVIKILSKHHLKTDYAAGLLFQKVLDNIKDDDRHFDRLLLALRDLELDNLVEDLKSLSQSTTPPRPAMNAPEHAMELDSEEDDDFPTDTPPGKMVEEEVSDSGIVQHSTSGHYPSPMDADHPVPYNIIPFHIHQSHSPLYDNQSEEHHHEHEQSFEMIESEQPPHDANSFDGENHSPDLPLQPQIMEPQYQDENFEAPQSVQPQDNGSTSLSMLLVGQSVYTAPPAMMDIGGSSENVVHQVTQQLTEIRLELQSKERELQARNQEMQENSDLLARCRELEEHVNRMENEVEEQKQRTDRISSEKDVEINRWKRRCEEKEREIEMLRSDIARREQEKRNLTVAHKAEIQKLRQRQNESTREMMEYENKVAALDSALQEATSKIEAAEQQLKEADSKLQMAENERLMALNKLLENMCAKERELSQLKEANLKLEIEIQSLVVLTKEQEALLHQKDKELAQHKQAVAEERHNTCAHELNQERRQSQQLQEENLTLKRQLSELQERMSVKESLAKRSKTD